jgi:hypothetical protein
MTKFLKKISSSMSKKHQNFRQIFRRKYFLNPNIVQILALWSEVVDRLFSNVKERRLKAAHKAANILAIKFTMWSVDVISVCSFLSNLSY